MACVTLIHFEVLINGYSSNFFIAGRGLRQGCLLSPPLFILMMDYLSLKLRVIVLEGHFDFIRLMDGIRISHNFFVDDILAFSMISNPWWRQFHDILQLFGDAYGMKENEGKSFISYSAGNPGEINEIGDMFNFRTMPLCEGLIYFGF